MKSWIILVIAGICEVVWALGLKASDGLKKPFEAAVTVVFLALSFYLLGLAARKIPISIAYTVWVGIGAVGAFLGGISFFGEKVTIEQALFLIVIVICMIGLKISYLQS
ncbi:MAG: DMT family transporter [Holosporales bacterium]